MSDRDADKCKSVVLIVEFVVWITTRTANNRMRSRNKNKKVKKRRPWTLFTFNIALEIFLPYPETISLLTHSNSVLTNANEIHYVYILIARIFIDPRKKINLYLRKDNLTRMEGETAADDVIKSVSSSRAVRDTKTLACDKSTGNRETELRGSILTVFGAFYAWCARNVFPRIMINGCAAVNFLFGIYQLGNFPELRVKSH